MAFPYNVKTEVWVAIRICWKLQNQGQEVQGNPTPLAGSMAEQNMGWLKSGWMQVGG